MHYSFLFLASIPSLIFYILRAVRYVPHCFSVLWIIFDYIRNCNLSQIPIFTNIHYLLVLVIFSLIPFYLGIGLFIIAPGECLISFCAFPSLFYNYFENGKNFECNYIVHRLASSSLSHSYLLPILPSASSLWHYFSQFFWIIPPHIVIILGDADFTPEFFQYTINNFWLSPSYRIFLFAWFTAFLFIFFLLEFYLFLSSSLHHGNALALSNCFHLS